MSDKKQSSVEWLIGEIIRHQMTFYGTSSMPLWIIEQAKAMHKEEIIHSHLLGLIHSLEKEATKQAEDYYNKTFGGTDG